MAAGDYIIHFTTGNGKPPITIHIGEVNGPSAPNSVGISKADAVNQQFVINGDYTNRFIAGFTFNVTQSTDPGNNIGYTVAAPGAVYQPPLSVTSYDQGLSEIQILGNWTAIYTLDRAFAIEAATNNNGTWITRSSSFDGVHTKIIVKNSVLPPADIIFAGTRDGNSIINSPTDGIVKAYITVIPVVAGPPITDVNTGIINWTMPIAEPGTSLMLPGRGYQGYGPLILENFVRMMENFCSPIAPVNPTQGQLWFKSDDETLYIRKSTGWALVTTAP